MCVCSEVLQVAVMRKWMCVCFEVLQVAVMWTHHYDAHAVSKQHLCIDPHKDQLFIQTVCAAFMWCSFCSLFTDTTVSTAIVTMCPYKWVWLHHNITPTPLQVCAVVFTLCCLSVMPVEPLFVKREGKRKNECVGGSPPPPPPPSRTFLPQPPANPQQKGGKKTQLFKQMC